MSERERSPKSRARRPPIAEPSRNERIPEITLRRADPGAFCDRVVQLEIRIARWLVLRPARALSPRFACLGESCPVAGDRILQFALGNRRLDQRMKDERH